MFQTLSFIKRVNWLLFAPVFLLLSFGVFGVLSATFGDHGFTYFFKQLIFLAFSLLAFLAVRSVNWRFFKNEGKTLFLGYLLSLGLLAGLFVLGSQIRGAVSWYRIGSLGFEPVEFAKIILVLVLAKYFSLRHVEIFQIRHIIVSFLYAGVPILLVLLQPDLGSAMILGGIWFSMVLFAGIKFKHLAAVIFLALVFLVFAWHFVLFDYQKDRITSFLDPERDPHGSSYNLMQSLISVGSGGIMGKGFGRGSQTQLGFLPESYSDFIFASLSEELGFFGSSLILILYFLLLFAMIRAGQKTEDNFSRLTIFGFAAMFLVEIFINIGMNIGLLPITGTPLPFLSYGGSNLLLSFTSLGIIASLVKK